MNSDAIAADEAARQDRLAAETVFLEALAERAASLPGLLEREAATRRRVEEGRAKLDAELAEAVGAREQCERATGGRIARAEAVLRRTADPSDTRLRPVAAGLLALRQKGGAPADLAAIDAALARARELQLATDDLDLAARALLPAGLSLAGD